MNILETPLDWVKIIEPRVFGDERGFFMESRKDSIFKEAWIMSTFVQDNHSKSAKWVLRWLHFQTKKPQAKLVRVVRGSVYDVAVDCRKRSSTYGKRFGLILSEENKKQLYVPEWCAHGFLTLEDNTEFLYKVSDVYDPTWEWWLMRNDPEIWIDRSNVCTEYNINQSAIQLSEKDNHYPLFSELENFF